MSDHLSRIGQFLRRVVPFRRAPADPREEALERLCGPRTTCPTCKQLFFVERGYLVVFYQHGDITDLPDDCSGHTCSSECAEKLGVRVREQNKDDTDQHVVLPPGLL